MTDTARTLRPRSLALGLAAALIALSAGAMAGTASTRAQSPTPIASTCTSQARVSTLPRMALVGNRVAVTTALQFRCIGEGFPLHIVLVLDGTRSMAGEPTETLKRQAKQLVDDLELASHPTTSVAVVEINQPSKSLCALTDSVAQLHGCIDHLASDGGSDIAGAIGLAIDEMGAGRAGVMDRDSIREVIVVLTAGNNSAGCGPVQAIAGQAKGQGILMLTACVTAGCDPTCIRGAATSPRYYFESVRLDQIGNFFTTIRKQFQKSVVKQAALTETLGSAFELVEGSVVPEPRTLEGRQIEWLLSYTSFSLDSVTLTLALRPLMPGMGMPVLAHAVGLTIDNKNRRAAVDVYRPRIEVLDARYGTPPMPLTATLPISNRLAVRASSAIVGQPVRVKYHLQLPDGDAARLNTAMVQLRAPDHFRVGATWRGGRPDGQIEADGHGAQWLVVGTPADVLDLEAEITATGPGGGGLGVVVYRWDVDGRKPAEPVVAAVSQPVVVLEPATPGTPTPVRPTPTPRSVRLYLPVTLAEACLAAPPADIVAVVDASTSMAERLTGGGTKRSAAADALAALAMGLRGGGMDRLALVTFARSAQAHGGFVEGGGDDGEGLAAAYLAAPLADGDAIEAGITVGGALLAGPERRPEARGVLVVLTDGRVASGAAAVAAADAAKATGIVIVAAGIGPEVNRPLLTALASSPDHASFSADEAALMRIFDRLPARLSCMRTAFWGGRLQ